MNAYKHPTRPNFIVLTVDPTCPRLREWLLGHQARTSGAIAYDHNTEMFVLDTATYQQLRAEDCAAAAAAPLLGTQPRITEDPRVPEEEERDQEERGGQPPVVPPFRPARSVTTQTELSTCVAHASVGTQTTRVEAAPPVPPPSVLSVYDVGADDGVKDDLDVASSAYHAPSSAPRVAPAGGGMTAPLFAAPCPVAFGTAVRPAAPPPPSVASGCFHVTRCGLGD